MKESYVEGLAAHDGPESCTVARKGRGEALTGVRAGRVLSRESNLLRGADAVEEGGRPHPGRRQCETPRDPARSQTPCMYGNRSSRQGCESRRCKSSVVNCPVRTTSRPDAHEGNDVCSARVSTPRLPRGETTAVGATWVASKTWGLNVKE